MVACCFVTPLVTTGLRRETLGERFGYQIIVKDMSVNKLTQNGGDEVQIYTRLPLVTLLTLSAAPKHVKAVL